MTILSGDIKLIKSQVMLDTDDGGGGTTDQEVIDGQSNNMFPDISELDRTYGRISLRKTFAWIDTNNTDSYFGSHVIIDKRPADPKVSVSLFSTRDWFDRRVNAADRVESYLAKGGRWAGHVYEVQTEGQRVIQIVTRVEDAEPATGQALVIVADEGKVTEYAQYVRVTSVSSVVQVFSLSQDKDVTRKVVTIEISDPLRHNFEGPTVKAFEQGLPTNANAFLRETRVADAASYYGIQPLVASVSIGQAQIQVADVFTNIIPSSQQEVPLIDLDAAGQSQAFVQSGGNPITVNVTTTVNVATNVYLGSPVMPKTLSFTLFGQLVEDFGGELRRGSVVVGSIDYANGQIVWNDQAGSGSTTIAFGFTPAAIPTRPNQTYSRVVTADNRGYNWVTTLLPIPAPATLQVSYTSQGKVYVLRDTGNGQLKGADSAFGSGSISYETGTALLTTGALPDVGTVIMYAWGAPTAVYDRSGQLIPPASVEIDLEQKGIAANTVEVTWTLNGDAKSASDDGAGSLTGDATGSVDYANGLLFLTPALLPQQGTVFSVDYQHGTPESAIVSDVDPDGSNQITFTIAGSAELIPTSVRIKVPVRSASLISTYPNIFEYVVGVVALHDDPVDAVTGNMVTEQGVIQGSINYVTREVSVTPVLNTSVTAYQYAALENPVNGAA
ncbi:MAG: hypothetical protein VXW65_11895 [Pseudomonadota bacterium]|nr:hypothetical protein [Pseudomonadota bacterium]